MLLMMAALAVQAPAADAPAPKSEKKVCRTEVATGSIMRRSVCHTRAEWAAMDGAEGRRRDNFRDLTTNPGLPALSGRPGG